MAKRVAKSTLNATTLDILNVIRKNAGYQYQNDVPEVTKYSDIPKVGEKIIWHKFRFEIISMDKARIDRILVTQINKK